MYSRGAIIQEVMLKIDEARFIYGEMGSVTRGERSKRKINKRRKVHVHTVAVGKDGLTHLPRVCGLRGSVDGGQRATMERQPQSVCASAWFY